MNKINTSNHIIGIDLAKNSFSICVMNKAGKVLKRYNNIKRHQLLARIANGYKGVVAMEACGGAHYWARSFESLGIETRIIAAQFVKPFVKSNKNDEIDAEAICEAASRPQMRFVATKSEEQQDIQTLHRVRERLIKSRTALSNEIRGLLLEYGIVIAKGISHVRTKLAGILEEHKEAHSALWLETFCKLQEEFCLLDKRIGHYDKRIKAIAANNETCQRLVEIPGVGAIIATAIFAAAGNAANFKNGREFSAWLGLVPKQHSTGGKARLGGISKRGDKYLRKLLVQGARSLAISAEYKRSNKDSLKRNLNQTDRWLFNVANRRGSGIAIIALANKTARRIWKVLRGEDFKQPEELLAEAA